ncbi:MAG: Phospholipase D1 [Chrysothrix sp. TS-e1954]|nr:MAG: Phospholipase D1 [Chrysothrix sp. TS-e1954]
MSTLNPDHIGSEQTRTEPNTPLRARFRYNSSSRVSSSESRQRAPVRRATTTDVPGEQKEESATKANGEAGSGRNFDWKTRGSGWFHSGSQTQTSPTSPRRRSKQETPERSRPGHFRRITHLGGSTVRDSSPAGGKPRNDASQRWRRVKAGLKLLGQKRKAENHVDYAKSAELMAELLAGSPAALILASNFQRDERKKRKVPVLLEQLKIRITDSQTLHDSAGDRHLKFRIELEYGSGLMRMKWVIWRFLRDFVNLHAKYKLQAKKANLKRKGDNPTRTKLPRFPRSAFPYLRGIRGLADDDDDEENTGADGSGAEGDGDLTSRPRANRKRTSTRPEPIRRTSTSNDLGSSGQNLDSSGGQSGPDAERKEVYADRQRKKLEQYLREMIRFLIFRAGSNRLCKFLELSALGIRLAAEGGYHGKEGTLVLQSGKGVDWRKKWNPALFLERHRPMWFLVRQSYIVCVDSPEEMNVYDVFLVDPSFDMAAKRPRIRDQKKARDMARTAKKSAGAPRHHVLKLANSERKITLFARNERQQDQFAESIDFMRKNTEWSSTHRFGSFAPVRQNVSAQWLVDARDYLWNVSRAISMAQDVVYIHDWWLSPELYMRRPPAISHKWRLDRLLKRKAEEGVKIFIIMYRNINSAIPIDSEYSKFALLDLHPNIFVQRSPNQVRQNVFFWAHHEKLCIVDHTLAFCGGVDLCYGRWDTPQHLVVDDKLTGFEPAEFPKDSDHCQLWPGKDYSNPRILDFFKLDDPYGEMYDRTKVPRMPWHDIGMQIVGQPARDLTRHFVQRWNYLLRQRKPSRPTPFLLPPPDFNPAELEALGLDGTCEIQMLRSASEWSIGTPNTVEHSIMNAYVKLIEDSEHFVYIENQFFISSCEFDGHQINNHIGDALVERIVRAYENDENWLAIIVIPLMPGFQNTVDSQDGTSVRLIMQCQFRSICRGSSSIFGKLQAKGIQPEEYIQFYSLRSWGKIGPNKALVTEQLYIHAKCMIVDDRAAIIGSANINERSMLGSRDSEVAAVIRDRDKIDSVMGGEPYLVGRFPHTLRLRLMREHLGIDVDAIMHREREQCFEGANADDDDSSISDIDSDSSTERNLVESKHQVQDEIIARSDGMHSFNHDIDWEEAGNPHVKGRKKPTTDSRVSGSAQHREDVDGSGPDNMAAFRDPSITQGRDSTLLDGDREVLMHDALEANQAEPADSHEMRHHQQIDQTETNSVQKRDRRKSAGNLPPPRLPQTSSQEAGLTLLSQLPPLPITDDTDIGGPPLMKSFSPASAEALSPLLANMRRPMVEDDCMKDPLNLGFFQDTWHTIAENNTKLFRQVFRCMPDNHVTNWKEYDAFIAYGERFANSQGMPRSDSLNTTMHENEPKPPSGPPGPAMHPTSSLKSQARTNVGDASEKTGLFEDVKDTIASTINSTIDSKTLRPDTKDSSSTVGQSSQSKAGIEDSLQTRTADSNTTQLETPKPPSKEKLAPPGELDEKEALASKEEVRAEPNHGLRRRRRTTIKSGGTLRGSEPLIDSAAAEQLLNLVQGHLVVFPYDWLVNEERGSKWLYPVDQMAPMEI